MVSFAQKFDSEKNASDGNSIQEEIILESIKQAQEDLAKQISEATSSESNVEALIAKGKRNLTPYTQEESSLEETQSFEQEIRRNSVKTLLKRIEKATSLEDIAELVQEYETLLQQWSSKAIDLLSKKHLQEYLSIMAAVAMLQQTIQQSQSPLLSSMKNISQTLQASLISQQSLIQHQAAEMLTRNQHLQNQQQQQVQQRLGAEQALLSVLDSLKKNAAELSPQMLQSTLLQAQQAMKQASLVQQLQSNLSTFQAAQSQQLIQQSVQHIQQQQAPIARTAALLSQQAAQQPQVINAQAESSSLSSIDQQTSIALNQQSTPSLKSTLPTPATTGHGSGCSCPACNPTNLSLSAINQAAEKALTDVLSMQQASGHGPGCSCPACNPTNLSLSAINQAAEKALTDVLSTQQTSGHGPGCSCPACNPTNLSFSAINQAAEKALTDVLSMQQGHGLSSPPACNPMNSSIKAVFTEAYISIQTNV